MSQYKTGTVAVTNGSQNIVGTGTAWLANAAAGHVFSIAGSNVPYVIGSVTDDTHATLSTPYAGASASAQPYSITTSFTPTHSLPYPESGDIDTSTIMKRAMLLIDTLFARVAGLATQVFSVAAATSAAHAVRSDQLSADNSKFPIYSEATSDTYTFTDVSGAGLAITSTYGTWRRVGKTLTITGSVVYPATADASVAGISAPYAWKNYQIGACASDYAAAIVVVGNTGSASISFDAQPGTLPLTNANLSGKTVFFTVTGCLL